MYSEGMETSVVIFGVAGVMIPAAMAVFVAGMFLPGRNR
jgi:hypothetical protein